jgi:hypothetical protein
MSWSVNGTKAVDAVLGFDFDDSAEVVGDELVVHTLTEHGSYEFARSVLGEARPTRQRLRPMLQFGGIIGRARVVDVVAPNPLGTVGWYPPGVNHRWHMREQFGFVLADVVPLPFRPCKGALGFFELKEAT